jgi:predicted CoA-binding protein
MTERCEVPRENATTDEVRRILTTARTVAVVGLSDKPERASYRVAAYLKAHGYRVIPVNPNIGGVLCQKAYPSLRELPEVVDIVDIFRPPEAVPEIVEAAIARRARVIWMQEGIVHNAAAERARAAGLSVVMNKCLMKEHQKMIAHAETQKNGKE